MCENDEIRMAKLERVTNDQMTKRSRSWTSSFGLRHSFVIRNSGFVICLLILTTGISVAFAQKRNITEKDLWDFVWIGDPQVSPDGSRVAFVRVTVNEKKEGYNTSIWSVPVSGTEGPHQLTKGDHDSAPRWSPDGKFLLFVRATESASDQAAKKAEAESEHESDIRVITRAVYREDNEGYADPKHPGHIWTIQAPRNADEKVQSKQVTFGRFDEGNIVWSKDGAQI